MRAGFLGQNICALGFGIATLQAPRLVMDHPIEEPPQPPSSDESRKLEDENISPALSSVTNPPRLHA